MDQGPPARPEPLASELTARICGGLVWVLCAVAFGYGYATRDAKGLEDIGNALWVMLILAPAFFLAIAALVGLVLRVTRYRERRVGLLTWFLAGPPAVLGVYVLANTVRRQLGL